MFVATVGLKADTQSNDWIVDSGASRHMTFESTILHDYKDFEAPEPVGLGDGRTVSAIRVGKVKVITQLHNGRSVICWMTDVLYVPKLTNNLFSVRTYMQQLLKGTQCHLHTRAAAFRVNTEGSLVLDHP